MRIAIVADDLTGACDAAAPFAARGWHTEVQVAPGLVEPTSAAVLALNTDSRALSPTRARARVAEAVSRLLAMQPGTVPDKPVLYKKVDSTLRGPVAAEIAGCLDSWPTPLAILCPAFPANGRIVQGGRLIVTGRGDLGSVLDLAGFPATMRCTTPGLVDTAAVQSALDSSTQVLIADATTPGHLQALATLASSGRWPRPPLLVGSAGLSSALASVLPPPHHPRSSHGPSSSGTNGWLVIAGSWSPITRRQVDRLIQDGALHLTAHRQHSAARAGQTAAALRRGRAVVLTLPPTARPPTVRAEHAASVRLAEAGREILDRVKPRGLILTGGATAQACLGALGITRLRIQSELLPGIPLSTPLGDHVDGAWADLPIISKSGAFGADDTLVRLTSLNPGEHDPA
ncbi:MAG: four-carbon acid sugar kinase family protein [Chloroflexota bacterium]